MLVEIWSDVVCPWCAIGRARFRRAVDGFGRPVTVRYRSFELDPGAPAQVEGAYVDRLARKYGTATAAAQEMIDRMTAQASAEGLTFDFDRVQPGNTFDAHRLLHLAADRDVQPQLKERLLRGYLSEGAAIGTHDALRRLAVEAELDASEVDDVLAGDAYAGAVRADEDQARAYGIRGVPFFVIDRRLGVSGAQPSDLLRRVLEQAVADAPPVGTATDAGAHAGHDPGACAAGTCAAG
jgi:predicted DsbA family dithiol-disulfide isomerase